MFYIYTSSDSKSKSDPMTFFLTANKRCNLNLTVVARVCKTFNQAQLWHNGERDYVQKLIKTGPALRLVYDVQWAIKAVKMVALFSSLVRFLYSPIH